MKEINQLTEQIIGAAIEVHREKGPGLLESAYEAVLAFALERRALQVRRQQSIGIMYETLTIDDAFRADLLVPLARSLARDPGRENHREAGRRGGRDRRFFLSSPPPWCAKQSLCEEDDMS